MLDIARKNTERLVGLVTDLLDSKRVAAGAALLQQHLYNTAELDTPVPDLVPAVPQGEGSLVLVCDDDPSTREVLKTVLERQGYHTVLVASGQEALAQAAALQPAAILLDLLMPEMNGWETATALKAQPETRAIPIIIASVLSPGDDLWLPPEAYGAVNKLLLNEATLFQTLRRAGAQPGSRFQVLIVEDDPDCATLLRAMFEGQGIATVHARTAQAAIELSQQMFPDLLVLDVLLPDGDGFAVVNALRQQLSLRRTPVIVYSAKDLEESEQARLTLGPTHFVTKSQATLREFEEQMMDLLPQVVPQTPKEVAYGHEAHITH
jgi:CheY-like chemotaxis protein